MHDHRVNNNINPHELDDVMAPSRKNLGQRTGDMNMSWQNGCGLGDANLPLYVKARVTEKTH